MPAGAQPGPSRPGPSKLSWAQVGGVALGCSGLTFLAWRAYLRSTESKWLETLANYGRAVASLSSSSALLARDLHTFLQSDATELPPSLRQLNRLLQSGEVQATVASAAQAMMRGVTATSPEGPHAQPVLDRVLEAILSDRGKSLIGMAMGIATKNATATLCDFIKQQLQQQQQQQQGAATPGIRPPSGVLASVMQLLASEQGERLLSLLVTKSMKTAVSTYVEATTGYNTYEDFLSSISKQDHRDAVASIMSRVTASFCQEVALAIQRAAGPSSGSAGRKPHAGGSGTAVPSPCCPPPSTLTPSTSLSSAASSSGSLCDTHADAQPCAQPRHPLQRAEQASASASAFNQEGDLGQADLPQPHAAAGGGQGGMASPGSSSNGQGEQGARGEAEGPCCSQAAPGAFLACRDALACKGGSAERAELGADAPHMPLHHLLPAPADADLYNHHHHHQQRPPSQRHHHTPQQPQQQLRQLQDAGRGGSPAKPAWVRRVVELVREQEVRALCLDVVTSATREATRSALDTVSISIRASLPSLPSYLYSPHAVQGQLAPQALAAALLVLCCAVFVWRLVRG